MGDWTPDDWYVRQITPLPRLEGGVAWQELASCSETDPESFFQGHLTHAYAKKVCGGCEVRNECLEYALINDERFGVWGGLQPYERKRLKRLAT